MLGIKKDYIERTNADLSGYNLKTDNKEIKEGTFKGRTFSSYTKTIQHGFFWKSAKKIQALLLFFFTKLRIIKSSRRPSILWEQGKTGNEIFKLRVLNGIDAAVNKKTEATSSTAIKPVAPNRTSLPILNGCGCKNLSCEFPKLGSTTPKNESLNEYAAIYTKAHDKYKNRYDRFLETPLLNWHAESLDNLVSATSLSQDGVKDLEARYNARIEALNESFDFQKRVALLEGKSCNASDIQMQDIELPWNDSALKFILCSDEEILSLTHSGVMGMTQRQRDIIGKRLKGIPEEALYDSKELTFLQFGESSLAELRKFPATALNPMLHSMYRETLKLLTPKQLDDLDYFSLNDDQFQFIYAYSDPDAKKLNALRSPKFQAIVSRFCDVKLDFLIRLEPGKIQSLDFSDTTIGLKVFNGIALKDYRWDMKFQGQGIRNMLPNQILDALNRGLFDETTAKHITKEQIERIDLTKINCKAAGMKALTQIVENHVESIEPKAFGYLFPFIDCTLPVIPYLNTQLFARLTGRQVQSLDFSHPSMNQPKFAAVAVKSHYDYKTIGQGIRKMHPNQIFTALQRAWFDDITAKYVTQEQIENIDFTHVNCATAGGSSVISAMVAAHIESIPAGKQLIHLLRYIRNDLLERLTRNQVQSIDFKDPAIDKEKFNAIAVVSHPWDIEKVGQGIRNMHHKQIFDAISRGFIDGTSSLISPEQRAAIINDSTCR